MTAQDADESGSESSTADTPEQTDESEAGTATQTDDQTQASSTEGEQTDADSEAGDGETPPTESVEEFLSDVAKAPDESVEDVLSDIISDDESSDGESTATDIETPIDARDISVSDELQSELAEMPADKLARTLTVMRAEIDRLDEQLTATEQRADDLESRLARKQADFENYKKRQEQRLEDEKQRATEDLVERLLDVRDNLARAVEQDEGTDIRGGVESTLEQFDQELDRENVKRIEPNVGQETDPRRHEVLATIASDQPEDTIAQLHRPGYVMGEKVLRPAQVAVSDGSLDEES
jgi:molecular chaperone GrpE